MGAIPMTRPSVSHGELNHTPHEKSPTIARLSSHQVLPGLVSYWKFAARRGYTVSANDASDDCGGRPLGPRRGCGIKGRSDASGRRGKSTGESYVESGNDRNGRDFKFACAAPIGNIGYRITVCTDIFEEGGRQFAAARWRGVREDLRGSLPASGRGLRGCVHISGFPPAADANLRGNREAHASAEADLHEPGDGARDDRDGAPGGHPAGRGEPAPFRRFQPVSVESHCAGTPGQTAAVRLLREVVSLAGVLFAADQGKLEDRRRRRADQPGHPSAGYSALAGRAGGGVIWRTGSLARCTKSNRRMW